MFDGGELYGSFKSEQPPLEKQQLPLPEGEMFFFETTQFKPECCPSTYTSSSGCLCYEPSNFNIIATRGGNILSQTFINTYSNKCVQSS